MGLAFVLSACGARTTLQAASPDSDLDDAAPEDDAAPQDCPPSPCEGYVGLATTCEIAATPRPDGEAERLVVEATGAFTAPEDVYSRVARELDEIRAAYPEIATIHQWGWTEPIAILVFFDAPTYRQLEAGGYHDWDCANRYYGARGGGRILNRSVLIDFGDRRFNALLLALEYERFPGVEFVLADALGGDASDICLSIDGDRDTYVFDAAAGDCTLGCISHKYSGFQVDLGGRITPLGVHDTTTDGSVLPPWLEALAACRAFL